jgi:membrane-associated phospholipid phosphatase
MAPISQPLRPHRPVPQLIAAVVAFTAFLMLAWAVRTGPAPGDEALTRALAGHCPSVLITHAEIHEPCPFGVQRILHDMDDRVLSRLLSLPVWTSLVLLITGGFWLVGNRPAALLLLATEVAAEVTTGLAKLSVARLPPPNTDTTSALASIALMEYPSGHLVRATVTLGLLVVLITRLHPTWRLPAWLGYAVVLGLLGAMRVASEAHWPSDAVGSYLLGGGWIAAAWAVGDAGLWPKRTRELHSVPARMPASGLGKELM